MLLSKNIANLLIQQVANEMHNETKYRSVVTWFEDQNLHGWSEFFAAQATGEYSHRQKIIDYLHDKNQHVPYLMIPAVDLKIPDIRFLAVYYYQTELETTRSLYDIAKAAQAENDLGTVSWLYDFLIPEQIEEEATALDVQSLINRAVGADGQINAFALELLDEKVKEMVG